MSVIKEIYLLVQKCLLDSRNLGLWTQLYLGLCNSLFFSGTRQKSPSAPPPLEIWIKLMLAKTVISFVHFSLNILLFLACSCRLSFTLFCCKILWPVRNGLLNENSVIIYSFQMCGFLFLLRENNICFKESSLCHFPFNRSIQGLPSYKKDKWHYDSCEIL